MKIQMCSFPVCITCDALVVQPNQQSNIQPDCEVGGNILQKLAKIETM